jgi:hypothetical protein
VGSVADPNVTAAFRRAAKRKSAPPVVTKALYAAGIVESGLQNLDHGDRDSVGALQQRPSQGWKGLRNPEKAAGEFIDRAKAYAAAHPGATSGEVAQAVQRSAFPGRYSASDVQKAAQRYLQGAGASSNKGSSPTVSITGKVTAAQDKPSFAAAAEQVLRSGARHGLPKLGTSRLAQAQYLFKNGLATEPGDTQVQEKITTTPGKPTDPAHHSDTSAKGTVNFEGHPVAAWIAPELRWARAHGWKGSVNSGFRTLADQTRIYNSGVRPAAKPGTSNHEGADFPRGAVDVSDAQGLARVLAKKPGGSPLKWAGAKDPVHFSHPHGGSY